MNWDCHSDLFITRMNDLYFNGSEGINGLSVKTTSKKDEDIIEKNLEKGIFSPECIAWKFGQLKGGKINYDFEKRTIFNGYKNVKWDEIDNSFKEYYGKNIKVCSVEDMEHIFVELAKKAPKNFGSVHIINLIFFLSKGNVPIYDYYVHKALKAIHMGKKPYEVYVSEMPSKKESKKVVNVMKEFVWLYEAEYPNKWKKNRELDRALWVYGHITDKFSEEWITDY